ncbi:MAG: 30S ribosome-binding factor RbfA [Candidatus Binatia bacterium]
MAGRRAERVGRQVVQSLASVVESGVHDPRLFGITFTSASASDDLRNVRVFYTVFGEDKAVRDAARDGLKAASGFLRRELAHRMSLRYVPALSFEYDSTVYTSERIDQLLRESPDPQDPQNPRGLQDLQDPDDQEDS